MPNVNQVAEIAVGVVIVVALLLLLMIGNTLVPELPFLIEHMSALVEILHHRLIYQLDDHCHVWWS